MTPLNRKVLKVLLAIWALISALWIWYCMSAWNTVGIDPGTIARALSALPDTGMIVQAAPEDRAAAVTAYFNETSEIEAARRRLGVFARTFFGLPLFLLALIVFLFVPFSRRTST